MIAFKTEIWDDAEWITSYIIFKMAWLHEKKKISKVIGIMPDRLLRETCAQFLKLDWDWDRIDDDDWELLNKLSKMLKPPETMAKRYKEINN